MYKQIFMIECSDDIVPMRFSDSAELLAKIIAMGASRETLEAFGTAAFTIDGLSYAVTMLDRGTTLADVAAVKGRA